MNYFTDQNDLKKLDSFSPEGPGMKDKHNAGVLDIFVTSIMKVSKLAEMCIENSSRFVFYVIFMATLVAIMNLGVPTASRIVSFGGFKELFTNGIPHFTVADGVLTADKKFEMKVSNAYIILDSDIREYTRNDFEKTGIYIAIGSRNIKMVNYSEDEKSSSYNEIYSYPISMLMPDGMSNSTLVTLIPMFYISMIIVFILEAVVVAAKYLILAGCYAVFNKLFLYFTTLPMTNSDAFHLCFYAQTIGILLVNLNSAIGFFLPSFVASIIGVIITICVINNAMKPHMPNVDDIMNIDK